MTTSLKLGQRGKNLEVNLVGPDLAKEHLVGSDLTLPELLKVLVVRVPACPASLPFHLGDSCLVRCISVTLLRIVYCYLWWEIERGFRWEK